VSSRTRAPRRPGRSGHAPLQMICHSGAVPAAWRRLPGVRAFIMVIPCGSCGLPSSRPDNSPLMGGGLHRWQAAWTLRVLHELDFSFERTGGRRRPSPAPAGNLFPESEASLIGVVRNPGLGVALGARDDEAFQSLRGPLLRVATPVAGDFHHDALSLVAARRTEKHKSPRRMSRAIAEDGTSLKRCVTAAAASQGRNHRTGPGGAQGNSPKPRGKNLAVAGARPGRRTGRPGCGRSTSPPPSAPSRRGGPRRASGGAWGTARQAFWSSSVIVRAEGEAADGARRAAAALRIGQPLQDPLIVVGAVGPQGVGGHRGGEGREGALDQREVLYRRGDLPVPVPSARIASTTRGRPARAVSVSVAGTVSTV